MPRRRSSARKATTVLVSQWRYHGSSLAPSGFEGDEEVWAWLVFAGGAADLDLGLEEWWEADLEMDLLLPLPLTPLEFLLALLWLEVLPELSGGDFLLPLPGRGVVFPLPDRAFSLPL